MRYIILLQRDNRLVFFTFLVMLSFVQLSCKKYLDKKPQQNLAIPSSLNELEAVLDNQSGNSSSPGDLEFVADNYYLTNTSWSNARVTERDGYIWDKNATTTSINIWISPYQAVYNANFILDILPKISFEESERSHYNAIKGAALFFRAFMFHQLAQLFCKPYSSSAGTDPGIVLRLTSNINEASARSTVQQTYDQIISDLRSAIELLPETYVYATRPNKVAANGLLARVFISMRDYTNAKVYSSSCLALNNSLLDYNSSPTALPGILNNPEVLFISKEGYAPYGIFEPSNCKIDSNLYKSYAANDLRKTIFFGVNTDNTNYWKGSYFPDYGQSDIFDGVATDEIYLIQAECLARSGNIDSAMYYLNTLLRKRWKTGTFTDLTASTSSDALNQILTERRKELVFRGLRWSDLRRFNLEGANITLNRIINGNQYTLPPNDLRWVILIPDVEITRSGIAQNPR